MSSTFYWETDAEHRLTALGTGGQRIPLPEFQRDGLTGQRRWELPYLSPDEVGWQSHRALLDAHKPFRDFAFSRLGSDRIEHHIVVTGDPVFDASGTFKGYRGVGSDITEERRVEQALRESEQRYRSIFESLQDAYVETSLDGTVVEVSPQIEKLSGGQYKREDFLGRSSSDFYSDPQQRQAFLQALRADGHVSDFELTFRNRDGSLMPSSVSAKLELDSHGRPVRIVSTMRDISQRKRAEQELRAAEEQFRSLVEQSIAGIYIVQDGKIGYANRRFAELFGHADANELIGADVLTLVAQEDRGAVRENLRRRIDGEIATLGYDFEAVRKDGTVFIAGVHGSRATHNGRPAVIGMIQDISEKKHAEEQISRYVAQLENAFMRTVEVATTLVELRDPYTAGHERRVGEIAVAIGAELGFDARRQEGLRAAGYLHDIGKITVPTEILAKPGKLSTAEFALIKEHPRAGYDVLKDVKFPWPVAEVALQHHERLDGSGYPQGLKGDAILLEARIVAVADVVEAMSSHRPFRPALGIDKALAEIERGRGLIYDQAAADACLKLFRENGYTIPD